MVFINDALSNLVRYPNTRNVIFTANDQNERMKLVICVGGLGILQRTSSLERLGGEWNTEKTSYKAIGYEIELEQKNESLQMTLADLWYFKK